MGNSHQFGCIMFDIIITISDGIEKVADDVTMAAEAAFPVLADLTFYFALQVAFTALLS